MVVDDGIKEAQVASTEEEEEEKGALSRERALRLSLQDKVCELQSRVDFSFNSRPAALSLDSNGSGDTWENFEDLTPKQRADVASHLTQPSAADPTLTPLADFKLFDDDDLPQNL